jgi:radical SAM superfamily enzyme YgiQ (UPF0313 family)
VSLRDRGAILLVSCYELGHQPLGIAWPRAFLERAGYAPEPLDLSVEEFDEAKVRRARFIGIAVPMHTALRLGAAAARRIRQINPRCFICFYGLYALLNAGYLQGGIADAVIGGEFEGPLVDLVAQIERGAAVSGGARAPSLARLAYPVPARDGLPELNRYVHFARGGDVAPVPAGYVEASRGCLHECLHCPIPPVYGGRFFVVPQDVVLADIRRQIAAGAGHITFGDPDFLNGPGHALKVARALHAEFPGVSYDFTAKVEHILEHRELFAEFATLGCAFVVSAVESLSDRVLTELEKGHTGGDVRTALAIVRGAGLTLRPTFVAFTPWTALPDYLDLLRFVQDGDLIGEVDSVQFGIRLLVPPGSSLLSRPGIAPYLGALEPAAFTYRWTHPDPRMDRLQRDVMAIVEHGAQNDADAPATFDAIFAAASAAAGEAAPPVRRAAAPASRSPRLTEPWFCCAEPTESQLGSVSADPERWV